MTLIGMPGAGKSTLGKALADRLQLPFIDTDRLIEVEHGPLQTLIERLGPSVFSRLEESILLQLNPQQGVIATGGSAVYSQAAMEHLRQLGPMVYLWAPYEVINHRLQNLDQRGLVRQPGQSLIDLYQQRDPLYRQHSDILIATDQLTESELVNLLAERLQPD